MRLVRKDVGKDGSGSIELCPTEIEDIWHCYNLIAVGDRVKARTIRRTVKTSGNSTQSDKVKVVLTLEVTRTTVDLDSAKLHVQGKNISENNFVKMGQFHTFDLELHRNFTLYKQDWDSMYMDRIKMATDPTAYADVAAVIMQEGLAYVCLVTPSMTLTRAKIEHSIPRKRGVYAASHHEKGLQRFYEQVYEAILRTIDFSVVKCVIIASPGFVRDQFFAYMNKEAVRREQRVLIENKSKFLLAHASSGHKHALAEVLETPEVTARLADTKAAAEVKCLADFFTMLAEDETRAFYGYNHVRAAASRTAIQTLLISDKLFRSNDVRVRRRYVRLIEDVKAANGDVRIFSSMHVSGGQLDEMTGVAAILRFPLPDLEEMDLDDDDVHADEADDAAQE